jgi:dTDP-4-dehydrorhamnose reductase
MSRADLGRAVAAHYGLDPAAVPICSIAEGGLGARPGDVRLDTSLATSLLKTPLRPAPATLSASTARPA